MDVMDNIYKRIIFKSHKDENGNMICPIKAPLGKVFFSLSDKMNDPLSTSIKSGSSYLLKEAVMALNFTDSGKTFIDIGANIGIWSFVFADAGYNVIGFEASKENYDSLTRSSAYNNYDCVFENVAVTPVSGNYKFISNGPYGHLANAFDAEVGDTVKGVSIDDYFSDKDIKNGVGLIKIDIEGGEIDALSGMGKFLADNGYPPCFVESNGHCLSLNGKTPHDLIYAFEKLGYGTFIIKNANIINKTAVKFQYNCVENYLFIHRSSLVLKNKKIVEDSQESVDMFFKNACKAGDPCYASYYAYTVIRNKELQDKFYIKKFLEANEVFKNIGFVKELVEKYSF